MKKLIILFLLLPSLLFSQVSPSKIVRIGDANTIFGTALSYGTYLVVQSNNKTYKIISVNGVAGTAKLSDLVLNTDYIEEGTVTSVSTAAANNGVTATWSMASPTPALTIGLGAITPTSVNGLTLTALATGFTVAGGTTSKTLTVPLDASVSGTNTGDQTNITGNAATVTTNANLTGPVTSTGNATAIANGAISNAMLANAAVTNLSGTNTGDQTTITGNAGSATNLAGGAGGSIPYQSAAGTTVMLANGSAGQVLQSNGTTLAPSWAAAGAGDMTLAGTQTVTGAKTFGTSGGAVGKLIIAGSTSGSTILDATPVAGSGTVTLPTTGTLATLAGTEALTNKDLTSGNTFPTFNQNTTGTASSFTGNLAGDVTGPQGTTVVAKINGATLGTTTATDKNMLIANGTTWVSQAVSGDATISNTGAVTLTNGAATRTNLGLGSLATQSGTFSGTSSGTNTGDQTNITGNADNVTGIVAPANGGTGVANNAAMTVTGSGSFAYTRTLTAATNVTFPTTGTLATLTGTEALTNKTVNGLTPTAAATGFTIAGGTTSKTLTVNNTLALSGTDATTMTFPTTSATIARTDSANTFTGVQTFSSAPVLSTGTLTSGGNTITMPAVAATLLPNTTTSGVGATATATGTTTITHGLGRIPTIIRIQSISSFTSNAAATPVPFSYGTFNSTGNTCLYMVINGTTTQVSQTSTVFSVIMVTSATSRITGVIGNVTSTTFDIVWTETGTHTAGNYLWEAQ